MSRLSIGIVGLPNVGKSTLFRALTSVAVPAENYPFCTIDPNVGVVEVPDERLERLAAVVDPPQVKPAVVEFVDIAGLVEGASRGEGLGNQFLQNIREVDAVAHVVRCFEDEEVARAAEGFDPVRDLEVVEAELALADLSVVERHRETLERKARSGDRDAKERLQLVDRIRERLDAGEPARREALTEDEKRGLRELNLLTMKPELVVANVGEEALSRLGGPEGEEPESVRRVRAAAAAVDPESRVLPVCAQLEAELSALEGDEREDYLEMLGLEERGLDRLIRAGRKLLDLHTFFTFNEKELRAWTVPIGATAPEAAGRVHSDFQEGFIRADAIAWDVLVEAGSMKAAREAGEVRSEGKDYEVQDGDVLLFHASP
jgi:GTP-binding protein YchF